MAHIVGGDHEPIALTTRIECLRSDDHVDIQLFIDCGAETAPAGVGLTS
jgi:hypothetical protein